MSWSVGKGELSSIVAVLESDFETVDQAASAVLAEAERIFQTRAKFVVVGQLTGTSERQTVPASDPEAIKLALGWYSTEGDARKAAESLWWSAASGDTFSTWVLDVHHGTPADLHVKRKEHYQSVAEKRAAAAKDKIRASIEKRELEQQIRQAGGKGSCSDCGHQAYDHRPDGSSRGKCGLDPCKCSKWTERKK